MFHLFFQERDARRDLAAHKKKKDTSTQKKAVSSVSRSPKIGRRVRPQEVVNIKKHPTQANLVGGKVRNNTLVSLLYRAKDTQTQQHYRFY